MACYEQALAALQHLPESPDTREQAIDLRLDLSLSLRLLGELGRTFNYLRQAETLAMTLDDRRRLGGISASMTQHFRTIGDYDNAIAFGQRTLAIAMTLEDVSLQVSARFLLGQVYHAVGYYRQAIDLLRQNVASLKGDLVYERLGRRRGLAAVNSYARLVWCLADLGAFAEGIPLGEEGMRIAEVVDEPFNRITAYCAVGYLCLRKGDLSQAISILERGLQLCQVANIPIWFPRVASALGAAYVLSERLAAALPLLEQGVEQAASMGMMLGHALWLACLGEAYLLAGRREDAITLTEQALHLSRTHKVRGDEAYALQLLGEVRAHSDPPEVEQAEEYYRQALALAEELAMRPLQAHCYRGLDLLYANIGQREQAHAELSAAIELYRTMNMTFWLLKAEAGFAELEGR